MLEGNKFLPETGIPILKIACIKRLFALADPVPLTFASLMEKSFTRVVTVVLISMAMIYFPADDVVLIERTGMVRKWPVAA